MENSLQQCLQKEKKKVILRKLNQYFNSFCISFPRPSIFSLAISPEKETF